MTIDVLGIDIAKSTFQLHGADHTGKEVIKKRLSRPKLAAYVANLPICTRVYELRGEDRSSKDLFSCVSLEQRVPRKHPLRKVKKLVDKALVVIFSERGLISFSRGGER